MRGRDVVTCRLQPEAQTTIHVASYIAVRDGGALFKAPEE